MKKKITININGVQRSAEVEPRLLLVHFLRENAALTGTHIGCETSLCGACTVLMDGRAVKSCTVLAVLGDGRGGLTLEGPGPRDPFHSPPGRVLGEDGPPCGFLTPRPVLCSH